VPCDPARREAARRDGDLVEIEPGTPAGLLRVDSDDLHHPAMRIHVAGGPHAGLRGFVSRWHLRREGPDWIGRLGLALFGAGAGLAAGAVARAALVLAARPESGTRQRA
jgi:hypothetical protein